MYPNLYYVFEDFFGIRLDFLRFINSFGFFVAIAFLVAAALLSKELKRKGQQGFFSPTERKIVVGGAATIGELITNGLLGFLFGFKILGLFFIERQAMQDPQAYIFSGRGNWPLGLITAGVFVWMKWRERKKQEMKKPEERIVRIWPHDRVGEITVIALAMGLIGAKLFDIFENWSDFLNRPGDYIFSGGGLTFYGGLICAGLAIIYYAWKNKFSVRHLADAVAPSLMIAYAIGRIGCQVAGDGDWGIYNSAFRVDANNEIAAAAPNDFTDSVAANARFFANPKGGYDTAAKAFPKPDALSFLPNWLFAYHYPRNVNKVGVPIPGCNDAYCNRLPTPVFPTPFYETIMCTLLFLLLWGIRKKIVVPGTLFCLYLIVNGFERFMIEKIRVNNRMNFFGLQPTQAEVIAVSLMIVGAAGWVFFATRKTANNPSL